MKSAVITSNDSIEDPKLTCVNFVKCIILSLVSVTNFGSDNNWSLKEDSASSEILVILFLYKQLNFVDNSSPCTTSESGVTNPSS